MPVPSKETAIRTCVSGALLGRVRERKSRLGVCDFAQPQLCRTDIPSHQGRLMSGDWTMHVHAETKLFPRCTALLQRGQMPSRITLCEFAAAQASYSSPNFCSIRRFFFRDARNHQHGVSGEPREPDQPVRGHKKERDKYDVDRGVHGIAHPVIWARGH